MKNQGGGVSNNLKEKIYIGKALFIIMVYFCIFSNIWASIIIASFIGGKLFLDLVFTIKKHQFSIANEIRRQSSNLIILAVWFISQIFEINGERAASISSQSLLKTSLVHSKDN